MRFTILSLALLGSSLRLLVSVSAFTVTQLQTSCQTQRCNLYMKRGRGSFKQEMGANNGSKKSSFSGKKTSSAGVRRDINWCPMPSGQQLPNEINQVGLLDTQLPTLKNSATNPTGAVAVIKADNEQIYCFSSSCPSCQIPLTKAKVATPTATTEPHPRLVCDFCKATYSLKDGARLQGEDAVKEGGLLGGIVKNVFSAKETGPLKMYKLGQKGKDLVIAVD